MSWARNSVGERGDNIGLPDVTTADNGKIMEVESGEWKLKEGSGGGGGIPAPASPSDGDVLTYDSSTSAWVAEAPSGGGGGGVLIITDTQGTLDKTFSEIYTAYTSGVKCIVLIQSEPGENIIVNDYSDILKCIYATEDSVFVQGRLVAFTSSSDPTLYMADSLNGYPQAII